jgi:prepilin-type N-terminal cleavage/methylation domain-containing protein
MTLHSTRNRQAFTLLELIVVMSIIALLATITISAVFRLQETSKESTTNTNLTAIQMEFEKQWKAKRDQIAKEDPPQVVKELTKNADGTYDTLRAKALHMKLRLRQEFPNNFGEVNSTVTLTYLGHTYNYGSKAAYKAAIKNPRLSGPNQYVEYQPEMQSAAMLLIILSQGAGGASTNPETIARTAVFDFPQNNNQPDIQLRVFVDAWGKHIAFRRAADEDMTDVLNELNQAPFVTSAQIVSGNMDPQDPEGRLRMQGWPGRAQCESFLASTNPQSRPYVPFPFDGRNRGPFCFSAGKDNTFLTADDLYSFRLQQFRQGN